MHRRKLPWNQRLNPMSSSKPTPAKPARTANPPQAPSAFEKAMHDLRHAPGAFPNVSMRWLASAAAIALLAAAALAWLALCLLYWQGSWQLLYHPRAAITRTPASIGLAYEPIKFAATETGATQLTGWWLPAENARFTVLCLHGADGNLSDTVDALASLHHQNLAIFAIDYRGYGQSQPLRPNERQLRQDAEWALTWLTLTRSIPAKTILVYGTALGANLAAELAADHSEMAGIILDHAQADATAAIFNDPRSHLVPAHWLVSDRYDLLSPAGQLHVPSLWLMPQQQTPPPNGPGIPPDPYASVRPKSSKWITPIGDAYTRVPGPKMVAWLSKPSTADLHFQETIQRWLDDL